MNELMSRYKSKNPHIEINGCADVGRIFEFCNALNQNPHVKSLEIQDCRVDMDTMKVLAESQFIKRLTLSGCQLRNEAARVLASNNNIIYLNMSNNELSSAAAFDLAGGCSALEVLILSNNNIDDASANCFIKRYEKNHNPLYKLDLSRNKITKKWAEQYKASKAVYWLNLSDNQLGDEGVNLIALNPYIHILGLNRNQITDTGAGILAKFGHAAVLELDGNMINNAGLEALAKNKHLISLSIEHNYLGNDALKALGESKTINTAYIGGNDFGRKGVIALAKSDVLTYVNFKAPHDSTYERKDARTYGVYAYWKITHFANILTDWASDQLDNKIRNNAEKTVELLSNCKNNYISGVEVILHQYPAITGGQAIRQAAPIKNENLLHLAVRQKNTALLALLLKHMPLHELYWKNDNQETYEDLAYIMPGYSLSAHLSIREIVKMRNTGSEKYDESDTYFQMLKILLLAAKVAALSSVAGIPTENSISATLAAGVAGFVAPALVSNIILALDQNITRKKNSTAIRWMEKDAFIEDLSLQLKYSQSNSEGDQLVVKPNASTREKIIEQCQLLGWKISFFTKLSDAEARAVLHVHKLRDYMESNKVDPKNTAEERLTLLLQVINGECYQYHRPAKDLTQTEVMSELALVRLELNESREACDKYGKEVEKLNVEHKKLKEEVEKYQVLCKSLDKNSTEMSGQISNLMVEVESLKIELNNERVRALDLDARNSERSTTIIRSISRKMHDLKGRLGMIINIRRYGSLENVAGNQGVDPTDRIAVVSWRLSSRNPQTAIRSNTPGVLINAKI